MPQLTQPPTWVTTWLSPGRLAPYARAAGVSDALDLYHWNCQASSALFELVGWFEVAWRNAVDSAVTSRRPAGRTHWLFDPAFPLQPATRAKVQQAIHNVQRGGLAHPAPGQVVADFSWAGGSIRRPRTGGGSTPPSVRCWIGIRLLVRRSSGNLPIPHGKRSPPRV